MERIVDNPARKSSVDLLDRVRMLASDREIAKAHLRHTESVIDLVFRAAEGVQSAIAPVKRVARSLVQRIRTRLVKAVP
jgi:hypothetical protein